MYRYLQNANVVVNIDCTLYVHGGVYGKLVFIATIRCRGHHLYAGIFDTDVQSCVGRHPKQHSSDLRALASQNVSKEKKAWIDGLWAWMVCHQFAPFLVFSRICRQLKLNIASQTRLSLPTARTATVKPCFCTAPSPLLPGEPTRNSQQNKSNVLLSASSLRACLTARPCRCPCPMMLQIYSNTRIGAFVVSSAVMQATEMNPLCSRPKE